MKKMIITGTLRELQQSDVSDCLRPPTCFFHQRKPIRSPLAATMEATKSLGFVFQQIRILLRWAKVAANEPRACRSEIRRISFSESRKEFHKVRRIALQQGLSYALYADLRYGLITYEGNCNLTGSRLVMAQ